MDKKELQKAQKIIDALFYNDKAITQWQHTLLENVISIAQTKLRQPDISEQSELLFAFVKYLQSENAVDSAVSSYVDDFLSKQ